MKIKAFTFRLILYELLPVLKSVRSKLLPLKTRILDS